jgi:hypothetical protein
MAQLIPPPPLGADPNSYVWQDWYNQISVVIDYLNELLKDIDASATNAQVAADAAQVSADAALAAIATVEDLVDDAQAAADAAQAAADAAQASALLATQLAQAAQDTANEAIAPDVFTPSHSAGAFLLGAGTATAVCRWNNNGTKERQANGASFVAAGNWYNPTTASIGDTHWIKFTVLSEIGGSLSGTFNVWTQLTAAQTLSLSRSTVGEATATASVAIATDSLGATIVGTGIASLNAALET